jgi:hypothetical protein
MVSSSIQAEPEIEQSHNPKKTTEKRQRQPPFIQAIQTQQTPTQITSRNRVASLELRQDRGGILRVFQVASTGSVGGSWGCWLVGSPEKTYSLWVFCPTGRAAQKTLRSPGEAAPLGTPRQPGSSHDFAVALLCLTSQFYASLN